MWGYSFSDSKTKNVVQVDFLFIFSVRAKMSSHQAYRGCREKNEDAGNICQNSNMAIADPNSNYKS